MEDSERKPRLSIARVVGHGFEHPSCGSYIAQLSVTLGNLGWFDGVEWPTTNQARILDGRNTLVDMSRKRGATHLLFIDPDMEPDVEVGFDAQAMPFFQTSWQFLNQLENGEVDGMPKGSLGVIAAPALSGPPEFKCNVLLPGEDGKHRRVTREESWERRASIERCTCIGTGLMLIPMKVFDVLEHPFFDDVYDDPEKKNVYSSQDSTFCIKCNRAGVSVWCNWYAWARHWKTCPVDRPSPAFSAYADEHHSFYKNFSSRRPSQDVHGNNVQELADVPRPEDAEPEKVVAYLP